MGQYDEDKCTLSMCVHQDAAKHGWDHLYAANRTWIHPKKWRLAIRPPRFVVDYTIEDTPVCDAASRVAAAMIYELRVNTVANVADLLS
ncbi:hypothetical protein TNCV_2445071 [Trichonephila clavipes]|nr:hypothetical protein TNCV_2445071 [Trichonephila clavipes]